MKVWNLIHVGVLLVNIQHNESNLKKLNDHYNFNLKFNIGLIGVIKNSYSITVERKLWSYMLITNY